MNNYGLTKERFQSLLNYYNGNVDMINSLVKIHGAYLVNKGYDIVADRTTGILKLISLDMVFKTLQEAVEQAVKDGLRIIPAEEVPDKLREKKEAWLDTYINRQKITEYCAA